MRVGIIDIGTNTINLLVAETREDGAYAIIHSTKETARLGKGGINDGKLTDEAMERGVTAIKKHIETIASIGGVDRIEAFGTSALRCASNSAVFCEMLKNRFDINVQIISGDDEAQMIYDGVKQVMPIGRERVLILDIGGGSCEFIIADKSGVLWKHSYELGMSRILDKFKLSDPITPKEIKDIESFIRQGLMEKGDNGLNLYEAQHNYQTTTLVGTSGSFDTLAAIVAARNHPWFNVKLTTSYEIPVANFDETYHKIIASTAEQRAAMKHMDPMRVDLIVPGVIFINLVIQELRMTQLFQCGFALKQGAIYQVLNK